MSVPEGGAGARVGVGGGRDEAHAKHTREEPRPRPPGRRCAGTRAGAAYARSSRKVTVMSTGGLTVMPRELGVVMP